MKYLNKNSFFALILAIITITSCKKDFLNVNDDPNRVTDLNITPELIFPQAEEAVGSRQASGDFAFLDNWMGYFAPNGDFAPNTTEISYDLDFGFGDGLWQNHYNVLFDLYQTKAKSLVAGGDTVLAGASMILSAKLFQELADLFGDIPYSQAFQIKTYPHPAYDKAQDVYNSLLQSLDTAIDYMGLTAHSSFADIDIINSGDQTKWIKFANTLRLRLLIRQSGVSGFSPAAVITDIQNTGGVLKAGENITVNPGYVDELNKQSPFYGTFGYTPEGNKATTSINANNYILGILETSGDPRISRFFETVGGSYVGGDYGGPVGDQPLGSEASYFGPALVGSASQDQWILPAYESLFLEAEAIARGWITWDGSAQNTYENAVIESFSWLGVPDPATSAADYLANADIANWANAGTSPESQADFIAYQKYIANCGIDPLESYSDERRLNFLTDDSYISDNTARVSSTLPLRLLYPQSEYTTNAASAQSVGTIDPFTTKIFWEP